MRRFANALAKAARRAGGSLSGAIPRNVCATASAHPSGVRLSVARKKLTSASRKSLPCDVISARPNALHGSFRATNALMREWYT